ncbi:FACR242Wp [Eremothecium gossypii FDAG1]|nr:FACR242Wp [Eremothecium gossypii FDAG1]
MRVVPWQSEQEVQELKRWFYPAKFGDGDDKRSRAMQRVKAYWTRGSYVPHVIDSTSQLVGCQVFDREGAPEEIVKLSYSMALIRYVNGMLDPTQQSQFAIPLHTLAELLGLPSWFVELRHAGTHERELPSVEMLRLACARALEWLWENYWDSDETNEESEEEDGEGEEECKCGNHAVHMQQLQQQLESYAQFKDGFKEYRYMWEEGAAVATSAFGDETDSGKEFVRKWLADYRDVWRSLRGCPGAFVEALLTHYDSTLLELSLTRLEWLDLEVCRWLLQSYRSCLEPYEEAPLLRRRTKNSKHLLRFTKRVLAWINLKRAMHYWDRWHPIFLVEQSFLTRFMIETLQPRITEALNDKKFRKKLYTSDINSQLDEVLDALSKKGISAAELSVFDAEEHSPASEDAAHEPLSPKHPADEVSGLLQDLESVKLRLKRQKTSAPRGWTPYPAWQPKPFGCL